MSTKNNTYDAEIAIMREQLKAIETEIVKLLENRSALKSKIRVRENKSTRAESSEAAELIYISDEECDNQITATNSNTNA